jgi:SAM-dependent methyltransferase
MRWPIGSRKQCCLCGASVGGFLPYRQGSRALPAAMRELRVVGSDLDHFECPRCGAHDRERHLLLYLRATGFWQRIPSLRVLHFAPERRLARLLSAAGPALYVKCDLVPTASDIQRIDMLGIPYPDASFDLVFANHVLEHVADDRAAVSEVARVLAPGGHAILQTPYSAVLQSTLEDAGISSPSARLQLYGQEDHVRLFGQDVFSRIASAGLEPLVVRHAAALPDTEPSVFGVNADEPFFLFRKPGSDQRISGRP